MEDLYYEQLYNYLTDALNAEDRAAFEQQLETDEQLAADVAFHRELISGIDYLGDKELSATIAQTHAQARSKGLLLTEQHITAYLNDELEEEQVERLEHRMMEDEAFAEEMEFNQTLLEGVTLAGDAELQQSIKAAHQKMKATGQLTTATEAKITPMRAAKTRSLFSARTLAIAASFLLLIAAGLYFLLPSENSANQLYATYFDVDETQVQQELEQLSFTGMAISDKARRASLSTALILFQNKQYAQAADSLATHLQQFPTDETARLYYGISLMETKDFATAITVLQAISDNPAARWYQALSHLQMADGKEAAITLLQDLQTEETYGNRAQQLLNELE